MSKLTIVYGGQFGSEGKGQIARLLTETMERGIAVRVGGPNAGHSFYPEGAEGPRQVVQTIPVSLVYQPERWVGVIGSAGVAELEILFQEMVKAFDRTGVIPVLFIDHMASIITKDHANAEKRLKGSIGSTGKGVGSATADKIMRNPEIVFGAPAIQDMIWKARQQYGEALANVGFCDTVDYLNHSLKDGINIMIEGTQGYGLSLHTSGYYPFCTSRECTPQAMLSQTGINPALAQEYEKIMVCRTFPIRVGGNSGPLPGEITWKDLYKSTNGYVKEPEITTVTKKARRIAKWDDTLIYRAILQTGPTALAITFLDYLFPEFAGEEPKDFSCEMHTYLKELEEYFDVPVKYVSTGAGRTFEYDSFKWR